MNKVPMNEIDTIIRCKRCNARCKIDGLRNSKAKMLRTEREKLRGRLQMTKRRRRFDVAVPNRIAKKMRKANRLGGSSRNRSGLRFGELARYKPSAFFTLREKLRGR